MESDTRSLERDAKLTGEGEVRLLARNLSLVTSLSILIRFFLYSWETRCSDKGLIPIKDDGPWHMLRRKGVP